MNLITLTIIATILVAVSADCGCLKCSKHLRVVSPPNAPVMVIERGEPCICEKLIPYSVEVPQIVSPHTYPGRSYAYQVQHVSYQQPQHDPIMCQHGYTVEVPNIQPCGYCHYFQGLVARTDRVVIPARDECPRKTPTYNPIIEYLEPPKTTYENPGYVCLERRKRDLHKYRKNNRKNDYFHQDTEDEEPAIDWTKLLEPKEIKSPIRNPWEPHEEDNLRMSPLEKLRNDIREKLERNYRLKQGDQNVFRRQIIEDKPFRINIPLTPRKRFFRDGKIKTKYKPVFADETRYQNGIKNDLVPNQKTQTISSKAFTRLVKKSGKFADPENVKITLPTQLQYQKKKIVSPIKTRRTRSIALEDKTFPYYKISRPSGENYRKTAKGRHKNLVDDGDRILQKKYLKPFDVETIIPENQVFYVLNTPIRMLNQIQKMREHVSPMVQSIPDVLDTSANYMLNFGKRFRRCALDFFKEFFGNIKRIPTKFVKGLATPINRHKRDLNPHTISKRAIVKLVEDDDIHEFLREKLSIFDSSSSTSSEEEEKEGNDDDILLPVTPKLRKTKPSLVMEKISPKLVLDKGGAYLDIDGNKKALIRKKKKLSKPKFAHDDIQDTIGNIIEEARLMARNPRAHKPEYESDMSTQTIKTKISDILENIQDLIEQDFDKYESIYEELLRLQHLKESAVEEWKYILIKKKHNDYNVKINLLNKFNEMLSLKDEIIELISATLAEDPTFNTSILVKKLIRLQKLQCILVKIVETFGENIKFQTPFDVNREIKQVDFLSNLNMLSEKTMAEVSAALRKERDDEVEKQVEILDNLKGLVNCNFENEKMEDVAKLLWEIGNCEKIEKDTISEMNEKIQYGLRIRQELKIIFDLEKQIGNCRKKLIDVLRSISIEKTVKSMHLKPKTNSKITDKLLKKRIPPKKKSLSILRKNKH